LNMFVNGEIAEQYKPVSLAAAQHAC